MYDGARREIEEISTDRIKMKDLDAPDYGGILLGTSDVLAYDGWQQDMEEKGFEIISKAEKPAVEAPEQAEPEDKGPVSLRKVGDFYEMYGKMRRSVQKSSDCVCSPKMGSLWLVSRSCQGRILRKAP